MRAVAERLRTLPPVTIYEPEYVEVIAEPTDPNAFDIEHYGSTWLVTGVWLERLVQNINFEDYLSPGTILTSSSARWVCSPVWRKWALPTGTPWIFTILSLSISGKASFFK